MTIDDKLDIKNLVNCAKDFERTLNRALLVEAKDPRYVREGDDYLFEYRLIRSAVIQAFEISVEVSWKMMQKYIQINADKNIADKPKKELFRVAAYCGLISDPVIWWGFYDSRNMTSHTYEEEVADEVYTTAKGFTVHLKDFIKRIRKRR
jgi:nucleotidyltransferase substrate binding protein (TIGR01987 family)